MAIGPRLDIRQTQSLTMTPQLQQAIKLLALSNIELEAYVAAEVEKNPLLEMGNDWAAAADTPQEDRPREDVRPLSEQNSAELMEKGGTASELLDGDFSAQLNENDCASDRAAGDAVGAGRNGEASGGASSRAGEWGEDGPDFDSFSAPPISLLAHLMQQAEAAFSGGQLLIAHGLIGGIEPSGYMEMDLGELALQLGARLHEIEEVLKEIQRFDPAGVGARSLSECLSIQAREADRYDPAMAALLGNLDLLAKGQILQLQRICNVDGEDLRDMIAELRAYNPKPGLAFTADDNSSIVPDIFVRETKGGWAVELNSATLPRVLVNQAYYLELASGSSQKDAGSTRWIGECMASANWLTKALDQRQRTIIRVASEIVKYQEEFLRKGAAHLKPLTLRTIAEAIEMHESTVSRVTSNKYLSCERGLFELKYFFTSSIQSADGGEAVSAQAVKHAIKSLIDNENPAKILSDDKLVEILKAQGFDIARRTVAKYREALHYGSSVQRRRQKALAG